MEQPNSIVGIWYEEHNNSLRINYANGISNSVYLGQGKIKSYNQDKLTLTDDSGHQHLVEIVKSSSWKEGLVDFDLEHFNEKWNVCFKCKESKPIFMAYRYHETVRRVCTDCGAAALDKLFGLDIDAAKEKILYKYD